MQTASRTIFGLSLIILISGVAFALVPMSSDSSPLTLAFVTQQVRDALLTPRVMGLLAFGILLFVVDRYFRKPEAPVIARSAIYLSAPPTGLGAVDLVQFALNEVRERVRIMNPFDAVALIELVSHAAVISNASDVHIHPQEDATKISIRVDGSLLPVIDLPPTDHPSIVQRLKVLTRVVAFVSGKPQDGQFSIETPDGQADMRTSFLPTRHGEKVVMRVARGASSLPQLNSLGLPRPIEIQIKSLLEKPQGLLFFTGPTGSGKTTSIYASLSYILGSRKKLVNIATIEDPIEFNVPQLSQTQVNPATKLNFAEGLRALLRQDPNVLMVGEIRDLETARIAAQAGLTGHLILTTVHANSSAGVFARLLEMDVEPFILASVSLGCISQRLVRKLCSYCRTAVSPTVEEAERLSAVGITETRFFAPGGCPACGHEGYIGRTPVYEVLMVTPAIRELIQKRVSTDQLMNAAIADGTVPLLHAALDCARSGQTSLAEALRVAG